jgi:class 3 adenylate cyclase
MEAGLPCPLPEHPVLAEAAIALNANGWWGMIVDPDWRLAFVSDDLRLTFGGQTEMVPVALGAYFFGEEVLDLSEGYRAGLAGAEPYRDLFRRFGGWALQDTPGGRDELRRLVAPVLRDLVDELPDEVPAAVIAIDAQGILIRGQTVEVPVTAVRLLDTDGTRLGVVTFHKPAPPMTVLAALGAYGDLGHLMRMQSLVRPDRRPGAILFADLEASTPLARRMPTAAYFDLGRRLTRAVDACVVEHEGLVGRHVGDGTVAFFLAEAIGSESAAARCCVQAARALVLAAAQVAERCGLDPSELVLRFGLHWGAGLYVGQILTAGRSEVTALGDEVNECARIEACAVGGLALASKPLLERLDENDARALDIDPAGITYTLLGDLPGATEKARRDAPAIPVAAV